jgi:hypothetical protein
MDWKEMEQLSVSGQASSAEGEGSVVSERGNDKKNYYHNCDNHVGNYLAACSFYHITIIIGAYSC